jgi:hypothetical protein
MYVTEFTIMKSKQEENIADKSDAKIKVVDELPFCSADDDPLLLRKEEESIKSFYEATWPDFLLKRIEKEV